MQIVHGNQSCSSHVLSFLIQAYKRALPVYLPVYLIPALIVHRQGLSKRFLFFALLFSYAILLLYEGENVVPVAVEVPASLFNKQDLFWDFLLR